MGLRCTKRALTMIDVFLASPRHLKTTWNVSDRKTLPWVNNSLTAEADNGFFVVVFFLTTETWPIINVWPNDDNILWTDAESFERECNKYRTYSRSYSLHRKYYYKTIFFIIINNICNKRFLNHTMWCVNSKLWSLQNIMGIFEV